MDPGNPKLTAASLSNTLAAGSVDPDDPDFGKDWSVAYLWDPVHNLAQGHARVHFEYDWYKRQLRFVVRESNKSSIADCTNALDHGVDGLGATISNMDANNDFEWRGRTTENTFYASVFTRNPGNAGWSQIPLYPADNPNSIWQWCLDGHNAPILVTLYPLPW